MWCQIGVLILTEFLCGDSAPMATHVQPREEYYRDFNTWASEQKGWCPTPRKRACASRLNPGHVASATSLEEFEAQARVVEAKGVQWKRQHHSGGWKMEEAMLKDWVDTQQENDDCCPFAKETLVRQPEVRDEVSKSSPLRNNKKRRLLAKSASSQDDVDAACGRLVANLPKGALRNIVHKDARMLAKSLMKLCPHSTEYKQELMMQLEVIGENRCCKWHQDQYIGRMLITYAGPSTWMVDDRNVDFTMFEDLLGFPNEISDPLIVPSYETIHQPPVNSVVLIKGNLWNGIDQSKNGVGLLHKSPNMLVDEDGYPLIKRFALKVDLARRPLD